MTQVGLHAWHSRRPAQFAMSLRRLVVLGLYCGALLFLLYSLQLPQIVKLAREVTTQPEEHMTSSFFRGWIMQLTFWGAAWPIALGCLAFAAIGFVGFVAREPRFAVLLVLPVAGVIALVAVRDAFIYPRYMVYTLPAFLALSVEGARWVGARCRGLRGSRIAVLFFTAAFLVPTAQVLARYYRTGNQNIRAACEYVDAQAGTRALVASYGLGREDFSFYRAGVREVNSSKELDELLGQGRGPVYLLHSYPHVLRQRVKEWQYIEEHFDVIREFDGMLMDSTREDGAVRVLRSRQ
jgi:hypothetical protein